MKQLVQVTPNITCKPGMCLQYVRETFNIKTPVYGSAHENWDNLKFKHQDKNFPDVYVPVWFSLKTDNNWHVALRAPDGKIYSTSTPKKTTPTIHDSLDAIIKFYGDDGLVYLGWSEDIETVRIAEEPMRAMTKEELIWNYRLIGGYEPSQPEIDGWMGRINSGTPYDVVNEQMKTYFQQRGLGYYQYKASTEKQINSLKAQVLQSNGTFTETDRSTLNSIKSAVDWIVTKLKNMFQ